MSPPACTLLARMAQGPGLPCPTPPSLTCIRYTQSSLKGCSRLVSWIFLMTSTLFGDLFHVRRWLAGSWMCLEGERGAHSGTSATALEVHLGWWTGPCSLCPAEPHAPGTWWHTPNDTPANVARTPAPGPAPVSRPSPGALLAAGGTPAFPQTPKPADCGPCPWRPRHRLLAPPHWHHWGNNLADPEVS